MKHTKLGKEFTDGWKHFCDCIDFENSNLDEEAIRFMHEMPQRIDKRFQSHDALLEACKEGRRRIAFLHQNIRGEAKLIFDDIEIRKTGSCIIFLDEATADAESEIEDECRHITI